MTIAGTGSYVPEKVLTNADLEKLVDTSDEWILSRTGIRERRIAADDESTSDLGTKAALKAMEQAGITAKDLDLIITATVSPDTFFPATACYIQRNLGATNAVCFDISAGVLRIPVCTPDFQAFHQYGQSENRSDCRSGETERHGRLEGPQHMRPLRRWRRRRNPSPA